MKLDLSKAGDLTELTNLVTAIIPDGATHVDCYHRAYIRYDNGKAEQWDDITHAWRKVNIHYKEHVNIFKIADVKETLGV